MGAAVMRTRRNRWVPVLLAVLGLLLLLAQSALPFAALVEHTANALVSNESAPPPVGARRARDAAHTPVRVDALVSLREGAGIGAGEADAGISHLSVTASSALTLDALAIPAGAPPTGASGQFELWRLKGGGSGGCATGISTSATLLAGDGPTLFALRSRRTGGFVRALDDGGAAGEVGEASEAAAGALRADEVWWEAGEGGGGPLPAHAVFAAVAALPLLPAPSCALAGGCDGAGNGSDAAAAGAAAAAVIELVSLWSCGSGRLLGYERDGDGSGRLLLCDADDPRAVLLTFQNVLSGSVLRLNIKNVLADPGPAADAAAAAAARSSAALPPYRLVSVDYHIATAADSGATLRSFGLRFDELSLSSVCGRNGHCAQEGRVLRPWWKRSIFDLATPSALVSGGGGGGGGLAVLTRANGFTLCPQPHALRRAFFEAHRRSELIGPSADAFVCSHPAALCELWLPFNRPLIVVVTTNLELARENPSRWRAWLRTVRALAADNRTVLAANSHYDVAYVRHFARVTPLLLPTLASFVDAQYSPTTAATARARFLLAPTHSAAAQAVLEDARARTARLGVRVDWLRALYPEYTHGALSAHAGVVLFPYTKSAMTFFELYRMGVPVFAPSAALLEALEASDAVLSERIYWSAAPAPADAADEPSPNTRADAAAVREWVARCDHLRFPHVLLFDSGEHLAQLLARTSLRELRAVSARMRAHTAAHDVEVRERWAAGLRRIFARAPPPGRGAVAGALDDELERRFGLALPRAEPDCSRHSAPDEGRWA